jgi:hypothetical protein
MDINALQLQRFVGFGSKNSQKISITKSYSFGIPPALYSEYDLENISFVEIYFDPNEQAIALHFLKEKSDACFKLIKYGQGDKRGASFVAKSFFTRYKLEPSKISGKYEVTKIQREGIGTLFVFQLKEHGVSLPNISEKNT